MSVKALLAGQAAHPKGCDHPVLQKEKSLAAPSFLPSRASSCSISPSRCPSGVSSNLDQGPGASKDPASQVILAALVSTAARAGVTRAESEEDLQLGL